MASPKLAPEPGQKFTTPSGMPASSSSSTNFAATVGESLDGFRMTVLPHTMEAKVMPAMMAQGKFQGRAPGPQPRGKVERVVPLPGQLPDGLGLREAQRFAGIEPAEVDGLGDVAVGLGPVLADFEHQPRHKFILAFSQQVAHAE